MVEIVYSTFKVNMAKSVDMVLKDLRITTVEEKEMP